MPSSWLRNSNVLSVNPGGTSHKTLLHFQFFIYQRNVPEWTVFCFVIILCVTQYLWLALLALKYSHQFRYTTRRRIWKDYIVTDVLPSKVCKLQQIWQVKAEKIKTSVNSLSVLLHWNNLIFCRYGCERAERHCVRAQQNSGTLTVCYLFGKHDFY